MKIEEYLSTLPQSILSGEEIQIPPDTIREICKFADLGQNDTFYHLGSGNGTSLKIARQENLLQSSARLCGFIELSIGKGRRGPIPFLLSNK